jgi:predicted oxidoreductase
MTKRLARIENACGAGNDRHAVGRLIGIAVPHGTDVNVNTVQWHFHHPVR